MDVSDKPMETIEQWQDWYRKNQPEISKDSRENLHDTSNATDTMPDWRSHYQALINDTDNSMYLQKAIDHFADTLCEFQYELTGEQFYNCFLAAANQVCNTAKAEYDKTKQLVDILQKREETSAVS